MKNISLHLIFSFYLSQDWEDNFANKTHLAYLKNYAPSFTDAKFIIVYDTPLQEETVNVFKRKIIDIGFTNVEFVLSENTYLREAKPFYEEVVGKMGSMDGLVMWGHNKGVSNEFFVHERLFRWISMLYYGTVGLFQECQKKMLSSYYGGEKYFFGAPLVKGNDGDQPDMYSGAFFIMNPVSIMKAIKRENMTFPKLSNRAYAESFPGTLFGLERLGSHMSAYIFNKFSDLYEYSSKDWDDAEDLVFKGLTEDYNKIKEKIWNEVK